MLYGKAQGPHLHFILVCIMRLLLQMNWVYDSFNVPELVQAFLYFPMYAAVFVSRIFHRFSKLLQLTSCSNTAHRAIASGCSCPAYRFRSVGIPKSATARKSVPLGLTKSITKSSASSWCEFRNFGVPIESLDLQFSSAIFGAMLIKRRRHFWNASSTAKNTATCRTNWSR